MSASFSERTRYAAYAAVAIVAFIGYFSLDAQTDRPAREAARIFPQSGGLPALSLAGSDGPRGAGRDVFAFAAPAQPEVQAAPIVSAPEPASAAAETVQARPSLLAGIEVVGFVRRSDSVTVLLRMETALVTVGLGEGFGAGKTLRVQSTEGRQVLVVDNASNTSRTFTLSEE